LESVYKKIEVVGTSPNSIEEAVQIAVEKAGATVHGMRWFEVVETRGRVTNGKVDQFQVTVKVGFRLD
jgi:flavin-binding protein dodecin